MNELSVNGFIKLVVLGVVIVLATKVFILMSPRYEIVRVVTTYSDHNNEKK